MPVFGACFWPALFAVMQRYKDCVNEQKEMPAFIPFLVSIYNVRAYIYNKLFEIPLSPSLSSLFFVFLPFPPCSYFANLRPIVQLLANSQIMKPLKSPFLPLSMPLCLFLALYSSALFCSVFPCRLLGQIPASFSASFPCSQLSTFLR